MTVKFLYAICTYFGTFAKDSVHDLTSEQVLHLLTLNPDVIGEPDDVEDGVHGAD